jgi:hypothetical protein
MRIILLKSRDDNNASAKLFQFLIEKYISELYLRKKTTDL